MKKRTMSILALAVVLLVGGATAYTRAAAGVEVTIQNLSKTVLTPPVVAVSHKATIDFFELGAPASMAVEALAEGGDTSFLQTLFEGNGADVMALTDPIFPGESVTVFIPGWRAAYLSVGSMLLPTNDAFIGVQNMDIRRGRSEMITYVSAYDAGTEANDELCAHIPGPHCGGEGMNTDRDDVMDIVHPHPGIQGDADLSGTLYDWTDPVAKISVKAL